MKAFEHGEQIKAIFWTDNEQVISGQGSCKKIEIIMEAGQCSGVPWAVAIHEDGRIFKHNLAMATTVEVFE